MNVVPSEPTSAEAVTRWWDALPYGGNMSTLLWDDKRLDQITTRCLQAWLHHLDAKAGDWVNYNLYGDTELRW